MSQCANLPDVSELTHRIVDVNGIRLHAVESGEGPLVLLVHGFPESWYSWRHQLPFLAEHGYRAVAIDVRGYGRSSAPVAIEEYRMLRHVADNLALVAALGANDAVDRRARLGRADRVELGIAAARRLPCRRRAVRAVRPGRRRAPE